MIWKEKKKNPYEFQEVKYSANGDDGKEPREKWQKNKR